MGDFLGILLINQRNPAAGEAVDGKRVVNGWLAGRGT
jgi:hypothetical protein